jgi:hypothetical protein
MHPRPAATSDASNQLPQPGFVHMPTFCCECKKRAATGVGTRSHQTGAIVSGLLFAYWHAKALFVSVRQLQRFVKGFLHDGNRRNGNG